MSHETTPLALATALRDDARFLRVLAQSLVHDEQLADDVVQEAWVAVLLRPPRAAGGLRPWLAAVVRNLSFRARRGRTRRERREAAAALPEADPESPERLAERGELQRVLLNAVMELPAGQRDVVLLRYLDDVPAAEIARRRGVPDATVRTQLKRALDRLRAKLDARAIGGRAAWIALLAPWAGPPGALVATGSSGAAAVGGAASAGGSTASTLVATGGGGGVAWGLGISVVAIVAVSAWVWIEGRRSAPLHIDRPVELAEPARDIEPPRGFEVVGEAARAEARPEGQVSAASHTGLDDVDLEALRLAPFEPLPPAVVVGRLVQPDGAPAAGAEVALRAIGDEEARHATASDAAGRFRIAGVAFEPRFELRASIGARSARAAIVRPLDLIAGLNDLDTLVLERVVELRVQVVDRAGAAVRGASVAIAGADDSVERAVTDDAGEVHFAAVPQGKRRLAAASTEPPAFGEAECVVAEHHALEPVVLTLVPATVIRGVVVDAASTTLAAVRVEARSGPAEPHLVVESDAAGCFALPVPRRRLTLAAAAPSLVLRRTLEFEAPPQVPVRIEMAREAAHAVQCVAAPGREPLEGAMLAVEGRPGALLPAGRGRFELPLDSRDTLRFAAWAPRFAPILGRFDPPAKARPDPDHGPRSIEFWRHDLLAVAVRDERGAAVLGATVVALGRDAPTPATRHALRGDLAQRSATALPDAAVAWSLVESNGIARLFVAPEQLARIVVLAEGRAPTVVDVEPRAERASAASSRRLDVVLRRGGSIEGGIRDAAGGPLAGAAIEVASPDGSRCTLLSDAAGRFRFEELAAGRHDVGLQVSGGRVVHDSGSHWELVDERGNRGRYAKSKRPDPWAGRVRPVVAEVEPGGCATVELVEPSVRRGAIAGSLRFAGKPLEGAAVRLIRVSDADSVGLVSTTETTASDRAGRFELTHLPVPSSWHLIVEEGTTAIGGFGSDAIGRRGLELVDGAPALVVSVDVPHVSFASTLVDAATRRPIAGARLELRRDAMRGQATAAAESTEVVTDPNGRFATPPLFAGAWSLRVFVPGYLPLLRALDGAGELEPIELERGGWVRLVAPSQREPEVVALRARLRPEARAEVLELDVPRSTDGAFWIYAGRPGSRSGEFGWIGSRSEVPAEVDLLATDGTILGTQAVELPARIGEPPELSLER